MASVQQNSEVIPSNTYIIHTYYLVATLTCLTGFVAWEIGIHRHV